MFIDFFLYYLRIKNGLYLLKKRRSDAQRSFTFFKVTIINYHPHKFLHPSRPYFVFGFMIGDFEMILDIFIDSFIT